MVRWVAAYDRELGMLQLGGHSETPWFFRYVPFANLYDLSLAFAFGAGIAPYFFDNGCSRKNAHITLLASTLWVVDPANHSGNRPPPGHVCPPLWTV